MFAAQIFFNLPYEENCTKKQNENSKPAKNSTKKIYYRIITWMEIATSTTSRVENRALKCYALVEIMYAGKPRKKRNARLSRKWKT